MTLEQLRVFVKVVDAGSFTRAADLLATQRSYVSRVIAQLEAEFGATLLERTTRTQSITEAGREVVERAKAILAAVEDTVRVLQKSQDEPQGHLRVTCGVEFGMGAVGGWIEDYLVRFPKTTAEVEYATRELDLVHEGFDLAIRAGPIADSRLVARRLGLLEYGLFATPGYLKTSGTPVAPSQLPSHALIIFSGRGARTTWTLMHADGRDPFRMVCAARFRVNAGTGVRDALLKGLGIGQLPFVIADELLSAGRLVQVLPAWRPPPTVVHAIFPSSRYLTPKVRAFVELALERFPHSTALRMSASSRRGRR